MIGYIKSAYRSISGWETSHFGGYYRMIQDYPYISLDYKLNIVVDKSINDLGHFGAEKLIKLYILKYIQSGFKIEDLPTRIDERPCPWTGKVRKYQIIMLNSVTSLKSVIDIHSEFAPLFNHYADGILLSYIEQEIPEDSDGDGEPDEGDGEGEESTDEDKDTEENEAKAKAKPKDILSDMHSKVSEIKEHKPWSRADSISGDWAPEFVHRDVSHTREYKFSTDEIKNAENLIKLLDISFDPKSDIVHSLRAGKLDVRKIAEVPAGNTSIYKQIVEDQDTKPFTVCILADMSGSMEDGIKKPMQRTLLNSLYLAFSSILPPDKLFIYGHTGDDTPEIYTFYSPYNTEYTKNINLYNSIYWCQNYDGPVIEAIHSKIRETNDDRIIFISLSDGSPAGNGYGGHDDREEMKRILERARRDNFVTVGIGIQHLHEAGLYTYYKLVNDMHMLARDTSNAINHVVRAEFK